MTVDRAAIQERLKKLREVLTGLEEIRRTPGNQFLSDYRISWAAERGLLLAAEAILDVANHLLASAFSCFPETNEDTLTALHGNGVISPDLYDALKGLGGFRNILVHGYLAIDESLVYDHLQKAPESFGAFIREVIAWMGQYAPDTAEP